MKEREIKSPPADTIAIVLVSGGMDSCVTAAEAAAKHRSRAFLHASYGQRTESRELAAFQAIADHYEIPEARRLVTNVPALRWIGGSSLTDTSIPLRVRGSVDSRVEPSAGDIPNSYVPFRNAHLLSIAVSWGEVIGARAIYIGAVEEDSSGYPDCRREYYEAFNRLILVGTRPDTSIHVVTPLIAMRKSEIVRRGVALKAPLHLTWSCYQGIEAACGECDSCLLRLRGFAEAGVSDPISYRVASRP